MLAAIQFNTFIPVYWIDIAAVPLVLMVILGVAYKFRNSVKLVPSSIFRDARLHLKVSGMVRTSISEIFNRVLVQRNVLNGSTARRITHMMVFWGFLGLAFATIWDDIFFHDGILPPPLSKENFGNIVGNVSGVLLIIGMTIVIIRYFSVESFAKNRRNGDFLFLMLLYVATITGFATEFSRYSTIIWFADYNYALHIALVVGLIATAPFTHFFHALLTPFMRFVGRLQDRLIVIGVAKYPFYRKEEMAKLAEGVRDGTEKPTFPDWLVDQKKKE